MRIPKRLVHIQVTFSHRLSARDRIQVCSSRAAQDIFLRIWEKQTLDLQESFYILYLDRSNRSLGYWNGFRGGTTGTVVDVRLIFGLALKANASSIILAHNHPSGNETPSQADIRLTRQLVEGGKLLGIQVLDHLIITSQGAYTSLADDGLM